MKKLLLLLPVVLAMFAAPASAQTSPTPEGTTITNNVTVNYADANGNAYSHTASVSVLVAFKAGVDVSGSAVLAPTANSTGNVAVFNVANTGNGEDNMVISTTAASNLSITGYVLGGTPYATLALLNAKLALVADTVEMGGDIDITVVYSVAPGTGGLTLPLTLTATSTRSPSTSDTYSTDVMPPVFGSVAVVPQGLGQTVGAPAARVPSSATVPTYSTTFQVTNNGNTSITYALTPGATGSATGATVVGGNSLTIAAGQVATVTVTYSVPLASASGSTGTVSLGVVDAVYSTSGSGTHYLSVIKPNLAMTKQAYRDVAGVMGVELTGVDTVVPGETIWYKLTLSNTGTATASSVVISDALPAQVTYVSGSGPSGWTVSYNAGTHTVSITAPSALAVGSPSIETFVKVTIK